MSDYITLNTLKPNERAIIKSVDTDKSMKRRLCDIGLIESTLVECVGVSPLGDPKSYLIRGAVIAIRNDDSAKIKVLKAE